MINNKITHIIIHAKNVAIYNRDLCSKYIFKFSFFGRALSSNNYSLFHFGLVRSCKISPSFNRELPRFPESSWFWSTGGTSQYLGRYNRLIVSSR